MSNEIYQPLVVESLHDLADKEFERVDPLVENLLPGVGAFLFCGSSKSGKSYLAFDLGMHVCKGEPFWGYDVRKTDVLYLYLEDGERLLQDRMFSLTDEGPRNFYYTIRASSVETDLIRQLDASEYRFDHNRHIDSNPTQPDYCQWRCKSKRLQHYESFSRILSQT